MKNVGGTILLEMIYFIFLKSATPHGSSVIMAVH